MFIIIQCFKCMHYSFNDTETPGGLTRLAYSKVGTMIHSVMHPSSPSLLAINQTISNPSLKTHFQDTSANFSLFKASIGLFDMCQLLELVNLVM